MSNNNTCECCNKVLSDVDGYKYCQNCSPYIHDLKQRIAVLERTIKFKNILISQLESNKQNL